MKKLIVMCAVPGSGKSTYIKANYPDACVVSSDFYFMRNGVYEFDRAELGAAHSQCFNNFTKALEDNIELIVVDNTSTTMKEINTYAKPANEKGYEIEVVVLQCPTHKAFARNVHGVPLDVIEAMATRIKNTSRFVDEQWPTIFIDSQ